MVGAVYQMLNHGISTGALFLLVGMLYDRRHTRQIAEFGGLKTVMPWFSALFLLVCLSSIAVPGFNGFVGEFLILLGSWRFSPTLVVVAVAGRDPGRRLHPVDGAARALRRGHERGEPRPARPLARARSRCCVPLVALALFMGVASPFFTRTIEPSVDSLVRSVRTLRSRPVEARLPQPQAAASQDGAR